MPKSLNEASKTSIAKSNAAKAAAIGGKPKADFEFDLNLVQEAVGRFIQRVIDNINEKGVIDTGNITNITAEETDKGFRIVAPAYLDFQSKGVNGVEKSQNSIYSFKPGIENSPSPIALKDWSQRRGLNPFAVSRNIQKNGITPKNLWEGEVEQLAAEVGEEIANSILQTIPPQPTIINKDVK